MKAYCIYRRESPKWKAEVYEDIIYTSDPVKGLAEWVDVYNKELCPDPKTYVEMYDMFEVDTNFAEKMLYAVKDRWIKDQDSRECVDNALLEVCKTHCKRFWKQGDDK